MLLLLHVPLIYKPSFKGAEIILIVAFPMRCKRISLVVGIWIQTSFPKLVFLAVKTLAIEKLIDNVSDIEFLNFVVLLTVNHNIIGRKRLRGAKSTCCQNINRAYFSGMRFPFFLVFLTEVPRLLR